jgi:hypothetical protein
MEVNSVLASPSFQVPAQDLFRKASSESLHSTAARPFETIESTQAHLDLSTQTLSTSGLAFPGLFFTNYDEENPFPGFEVKDYDMLRIDAERRGLHGDASV